MNKQQLMKVMHDSIINTAIFIDKNALIETEMQNMSVANDGILEYDLHTKITYIPESATKQITIPISFRQSF